jgi:uncharacterized protein
MDARTAFIAAVKAGDSAQVRSSLAQLPTLASAADEQGVSAIMLALYHRQPEALKLLLASAPSLNIFEATSTGNLGRVTQLLDDDPALVSSRSADGFTALHFAAFFGQEAAATLLLDRGADPAAVAGNAMQVTPLHSAVTARSLAIARALLDRGAPVNARQQNGWTALHAAAQNGDRSSVELLLQYGADRVAGNDDGVTAIDLARKSGHPELMELLS